MFDWLSIFKVSPERQIARTRKKVIEPHGDPATRIGAAERLLEMGTPAALRALLDRFTINVSPSSQDEQEKNQLLSWVVARGEAAVEPIVRFLRDERQLFWPVRALRQILEEEAFAREMHGVLRYHWENPPASSDPTAQLIRLLEGVRTESLRRMVLEYLEHEADDVLMAALDYLFDDDEEVVREAVLQCYCESEERPRVRSHILEQLAERGWSVRGFRPQFEETLPPGYTLTREGKVRGVGRR